MSRFCLLCPLVVVLAVGLGSAQEKKNEKKSSKAVGVVVKSDGEKHTITVKMKSKDGKGEEEKVLDIKEGVKLVGEDGKEHKETAFLKDLKSGEEVVVVTTDGKVTEIRDIPAATSGDRGSRAVGVVVKSDGEKHSITVKMKNKEGTEEEKVLDINEGVKLVGEDGKEHKEKEFLNDLKGGEEVVVVTREGKVVEVRDLPPAKPKP